MSEQEFQDLFGRLTELGRNGITMNHYDLNEVYPDVSIDTWRQFLKEPRIQTYIKEEMEMIQKTEQMKIINAISDTGQNSTGRAQLISTLDKLNDMTSTKEGPVFIYTYIPVDSNQKHVENIQILNEDPFLKGK